MPFLSKVTNIPMAQVATKLILGQSLEELGYQDGLWQALAFISGRLSSPLQAKAKVDSLLGPEMKSIGEVMGSDTTLERLFIRPLKYLPTRPSEMLYSLLQMMKMKPWTWLAVSKILAMVSSRQKDSNLLYNLSSN